MTDFMVLVMASIIGGLFVVATVGWTTIVFWKWAVKLLVEQLMNGGVKY